MLQDVLSNIKNASATGLLENETETALILPVLRALGWDASNTTEVHRQFRTGVGQVDFGLFASAENFILLEAKRPSENLLDHEWQLLLYSFECGAPLSILSNGFEWWFYRPMAQCHWIKRCFLKIDLRKDDQPTMERHLRELASRESVANGNALRTAEKAHIASAERTGAGEDSAETRKRVRVDDEFQCMGPTRASTKNDLVKDVLRYAWRSGKYLTWLTGQPGGWQQYVFKLIKAPYQEVLLVKPKPMSRASLMRVVAPADAQQLCKDVDVRVYK